MLRSDARERERREASNGDRRASSVSGPPVERGDEVLTDDALAFVALLHRRFAATRAELLARREVRREEVRRTRTLGFLPDTAPIRDGDWQVPPAPADLVDRRVEITGPTERKMMINALNSGAQVWLADLEDANTPHWRNVVGGQVNLRDAVRRTASFTNPDGRVYALRTDAPARHHRRATPGLAPRRAPRDRRRRARGRRAGRRRALRVPQRPGAAGRRLRAVLLPAEDGEPPRGPPVARRLHGRRGRAGHPGRLDPGDGPHRDDPRCVRDGRDPVRARRPRVGSQRRTLGLPVQHHQVLPRRRARVRPPRSRRRWP